ncbi:MAG TPA: helix-hairpin-helix domain-containing protein [Vicinamibacterales bacterium]|nr:helix-hairpin-helix domain-containing protein [Vicinamibacterales bacterium]
MTIRTLPLLLLIVLAVPGRGDVLPGAATAALQPPGARAIPRASPAPGDSVPLVLLRRSDKKLPPGAAGDVLVPANAATDPIADRVRRIMEDPAGFGQLALRLDRFAKTYLLRDPALPGDRHAVLAGPAYLFLSDRQGGFPAQGFWLEEPDGSLREVRDAPFVDMVVDERDLAPAAIDGVEAIYAHELGHLVMAALAGPAPRKASSAVHFSTVRTDGWSAFIEGWGEHFQPLSVDHATRAGARAAIDPSTAERERFWYSRFAGEQLNGCWICPANLRFLWWQGPGEQRLRDAGVRANLFIHEPALPGTLIDGRPSYDVRMYRDVLPPTADGRLKNGAQALSSEGVLATFFYRLVTDERLQAGYREPAFYQPFLPDDRAGDLAAFGPAALVSPIENIYLKIFHVLHTSFRWGDWPALDLVGGYAQAFPDEAPLVYEVFLDVTRGVTVDRAAAARHAEAGYLPGLRDRLLSGDARLDGNTGPPLWIVSPGMSLGMGVFRYFPVPSSFTLDLNAADAADLTSVGGISQTLAASIMEAREAAGGFKTVEDLAAVPGMTPELLSRVASMRGRMQQRLTRTEAPQRGNPTWMMNWLATALKGSYYAAGAWQLARAAVVAGLAYLLAAWLVGRLSGAPPRRTPPAHRWWRRAAALLARAGLAGAIPLAVSVGLYAAGVMPGAGPMAAAGLAIGLAIALVRARGPRVASRGAALLGPVAGSVAASILIGWMY